MTATQSDSDREISRRGVLRKATAVGVGSAATVGGAHRMGVSPVGSARAIAPIVALGYAGAAGLGYLMYKNAEKATGDSRDYSSFTGANALKLSIYEDALTMKSADERVMTSIQNNVQNSENVALAKGKAALLKEMNAGSDESTANEAMNAAVNEYYSTIQENILVHYDAQLANIKSQLNAMVSHPNISGQQGTISVYKYVNSNLDGESGIPVDSEMTEIGPTDVTLLDGSTVTLENPFQIDWVDESLTETIKLDWPVPGTWSGSNNSFLRYSNPDTNDRFKYNFNRFTSTWSNLSDSRNAVNSDLVGFSSDVYSQYEPGEIPTEDLVDPITAATELGNNTGLSSQAAAAGMMGIPTSAGFSLRLELQDDSGEKYEVDAEIYTNADPGDESGNKTGFVVGETYDPDNFEEPIYASYEYIDPDSGERSTDFTQLAKPFTVLEATNKDGENVTNVTPDPKINQTADVGKLEQELAQIRDEQQRLLENQQDPSSGGAGGGFLSGSGPSTGVIAAVVGGIGILYALTQGGTN